MPIIVADSIALIVFAGSLRTITYDFSAWSAGACSATC
jgi:hypothetical protein